MRLIDADAFKQVFCADCVAATCENCRINYYFEHFTPTVDPTKHGHWINDKGLYKCSVCNELWCHWWVNTVPIEKMNKMMRFCPNCGAKMSEVEEDG